MVPTEVCGENIKVSPSSIPYFGTFTVPCRRRQAARGTRTSVCGAHGLPLFQRERTQVCVGARRRSIFITVRLSNSVGGATGF